MKDYLATKPSFPPTKATPLGWVSENGELLVAIKDLEKKLGISIKKVGLEKSAITGPDEPQKKRGPGRPRGSLAKPKVV